MKDTIFDLWYGNITPSESGGKKTPEFKKYMKDSDATYDKLEKLLGKEEIELLNEHMNNYGFLFSEYTAQAFVEGFSLGVRLITEAVN